jgi:cytochrome c-type biogenesis protein CcmH
MKTSRRLLLVCALVGVPASGQTPEPGAGLGNAHAVVGPPRGPALSGARLEAEAQRIALLLRCPVCQGLSVAESPSPMARNMRDQVRDLVAAGYDEDQVLRYFERSYGEFVRLKPPLRGVNWALWLAPIAALLVGGAVVTWALRPPRQAAAAEPAAVLADDPELVPYLLRVRETAYGWPSGVRPEKPPA